MYLATIEKVESVRKHPNADRLDLVTILGYQCVTQRGLYKEGDIVVYIKTDTVLPLEPWTEGYRKYSPKRVKAAKLREEWSEGIVVPLNEIAEQLKGIDLLEIQFGYDVSERLGITKYEPPLPQDLNAKSSTLPYGMGKTDEERWENIVKKLPFGELVDVTLKIDGSSVTYGYKYDEDRFFVTSRSQELYLEFANNYTLPLELFPIEDALKAYCKKNKISLALRGEIYGTGIQNSSHNPFSKKPKSVAFFSTYLIDERRYARRGDKHYFLHVCRELNLPTIPIIDKDIPLSQELIDHYSKDIKKLSLDNTQVEFEGVVIQHSKGSFKIINKFYDSRK